MASRSSTITAITPRKSAPPSKPRAVANSIACRLFQPHRYTRTQHLWGRFFARLQSSRYFGLTRYLRRQRNPDSGHHQRSPGQQHSRSRPQKRALLPVSMQTAVEFLLREARPGDAILTIGAGNVSRASNELADLARLRIASKRWGKRCGLRTTKFWKRCRSCT